MQILTFFNRLTYSNKPYTKRVVIPNNHHQLCVKQYRYRCKEFMRYSHDPKIVLGGLLFCPLELFVLGFKFRLPPELVELA